MKKILLVSTVPSSSGVGGVTIHTQRLLDSPELVSEHFQIVFFDYKKAGIMDYIRQLECCETVVHIHISNPMARLVFVLLAKARGRKVILTIHGNLGRYSTMKNQMDNLAVRLADIPILINRQSYEKARVLNNASVFMPAFIPPQKPEPLSDNIIKLLNGIDRKIYRWVFATNASRRNFDDAGNEIYGIGFLIKVFAEIKDKFLIISDPSGDYSQIYDLTGLPENVAIISEPHSFFELLGKCDGMIRATSTDGDAISVKEALYLRKCVVATDCIDRPSGVRLFSYNDKDSLLQGLNCTEIYDPVQVVENAIPQLKQIYLTI